MVINNDDDHEEEETEFDWSVYGDHERETQSLDGRDYVAIFLASLQTIFLPLVILVLVMLGIGLFFGIFFGG